jgi:kumamolisin
MAAEPRVPIAGSERALPDEARRLGPVDPDEQIAVTILVRRRAGAAPPVGPTRLARAEFAGARGADPDDLARVAEFARGAGLTVDESSADRRSVLVSGRAADVCAAFGVELVRYADEDGEFRARAGAVHVPAELAGLVEGVFGLDDRPQAEPRFRVARDPAAASTAFTPPQVAELYAFPSGLTGKGQCIAIVELGGGYDQADLDAYFGELGLATPQVSAVGVDGGRNAPDGDPNGADAEVMLDIEVAGAVAPAARIVVYFAPNTDRGFVDAVTTAIHDRVNAPSVVSISWGGPEESWTPQARRALDEAFADAAALGVTVCVASGDNGSADRVGDGKPHVDFPAASPHVLACGGTRLEGRGGAIAAESVWNGGDGGASGGGVSQAFAPPDWQQGAGVPPPAGGGHPGRGVPDVAGDADPATGYRVRVDGRQAVIGGTSAVAPLWAGLVALVNESLGRPVGFLNPLLYDTPHGLRDVTRGDNAVDGTPGYSARAGWDACTGLGSPDGQALVERLAHA